MRELYHESLATRWALVHFLPRILMARWTSRSLPNCRQKTLRWDGAFPGLASAGALPEFLSSSGVRHLRGKHSLYIPPQGELAARIGEFVESYPPDAGFKILLSEDKSSYLVDARRRRITRTLMGGVANQAEAAQLLYALGLGPRLYDLTEFRSQRASFNCFVVEHVEGDPPGLEEQARFLETLHRLIGAELTNAIGFIPRQRFEHPDFREPGCDGNLLRRRRDGRLLYIDPQHFRLLDRSALLTHVVRTVEEEFCSSQEERSGLRETVESDLFAAERRLGPGDERWKRLREMLARREIRLQGRLVLHFGCGLGLTLALALADGARWGVGWDEPVRVAAAERIQCLLGNSRLLFAPSPSAPDSGLAMDLPGWLSRGLGDSVVFCRLDRSRVDLSARLRHMAWKALILEESDSESAAEFRDLCRFIERACSWRLADGAVFPDPNKQSRRVALFLRS